MQLIIWPEHPKLWERGRPYKVGSLTRWGNDEFVCINAHLRSVLEPPVSSLWAKVLGR